MNNFANWEWYIRSSLQKEKRERWGSTLNQSRHLRYASSCYLGHLPTIRFWGKWPTVVVQKLSCFKLQITHGRNVLSIIYTCRFSSLTLLSSFSILLCLVRKPQLENLNHKILSSTSTQLWSIERDFIHFGIVLKNPIPCWPTSCSYSVGAVAEGHTRQKGAFDFLWTHSVGKVARARQTLTGCYTV